MGAQFRTFRSAETSPFIPKGALTHHLTAGQAVVSPAANGVPAEGSVNSLSLIDRTAERNHNLIAALIIPMQNERCPFYRLYVKTIYQIVFTVDAKRHFFLQKETKSYERQNRNGNLSLGSKGHIKRHW